MFPTIAHLLHTAKAFYRLIFTCLCCCLLLACSSCSDKPKPDIHEDPIKNDSLALEKKSLDFKISRPGYGEIVKLNADLNIKLEFGNLLPDSVVARIGNKKLAFIELQELTLNLNGVGCGKQNLVVTAFSNGKAFSQKCLLIIQPNKAATSMTYKVLKRFPHNNNLYTQGFEYDDGNILESTGQNGRSQVLIYKLGDLKVLRSKDLEYKYFGEGATKFNGNIYQLTWQSRMGFIYDAQSLDFIRNFSFPGEGWGICHNESELIMSDGTHYLSFLDPESLYEKRRIEVYDENGPVTKLNELEYADGMIYANVYTTDRIVAIDPSTGAVLQSIDMTGLLNQIQLKKPVDVLNGIAYKKDSKTFLLTGKLWPSIFEVEFRSSDSS